MDLPKSDDDRRLLASILMHEEEDLTPETVEGAVRALRRIYSAAAAGGGADRAYSARACHWRKDKHFCRKKFALKRALMDPGAGGSRQ